MTDIIMKILFFSFFLILVIGAIISITDDGNVRMKAARVCLENNGADIDSHINRMDIGEVIRCKDLFGNVIGVVIVSDNGNTKFVKR